MPKNDMITLNGIVEEAIPGTKFKVSLPEQNNAIITCTISGKLRMNNIKIIPGDNVTVDISPYDLTKGRITWRNK